MSIHFDISPVIYESSNIIRFIVTVLHVQAVTAMFEFQNEEVSHNKVFKMSLWLWFLDNDATYISSGYGLVFMTHAATWVILLSY